MFYMVCKTVNSFLLRWGSEHIRVGMSPELNKVNPGTSVSQVMVQSDVTHC